MSYWRGFAKLEDPFFRFACIARLRTSGSIAGHGLHLHTVVCQCVKSLQAPAPPTGLQAESGHAMGPDSECAASESCLAPGGSAGPGVRRRGRVRVGNASLRVLGPGVRV